MTDEFPGKDRDMPDPKPTREELPDAGGTSTTYKAADKLHGKRALITGGDSGIGAATAVLFAKEGAVSTIVYLPEEEKDAQDTKKQVESLGGTCHLFATDLAKRENCQKAIDFSLEKMGGIDILFNNAAYQMMVEDILDLPEDQWVHTFNINMHSYFYMAKYALKHMKRGAVIINNASINAYIGRPDLLDYTSTKGAIISFTRGLSNQYIGKGIRVNAVAPGPVWTPLIPATMNEKAQKEFTSPMGRPAQPSEIASCVVFLASMDSSCVSGQTIHCNGGTVESPANQTIPIDEVDVAMDPRDPIMIDEEEIPEAEQIPANKDGLSRAYAFGAGGYNSLKSFNGQYYSGMAVGGSHTWNYDGGVWHEVKEEPDLWKIDYKTNKRRAKKAPEKSGAPVGTEYHWLIVAHQHVRKIDANTYETNLEGSKYKLAHKGAASNTWSIPTVKGQREREVELLEDAKRRVQGLPPVLGSEKAKVKSVEKGQQKLEDILSKGGVSEGNKRKRGRS
ncbi:hypothetical protein N5P37_004219 [Trichoderma harzianum]|nr:hypothetical protein N5P37_004219 [Trichoderma harzianum]